MRSLDLSERFEWNKDGLVRSIGMAGHRTVQQIRIEHRSELDIDAWDGAVLRGALPRVVSGGGRGRIRIIDLFCGAGGLTLGVLQGLKALGYSPVVELAADLDAAALALYDRNFGPAEIHRGDVDQLVAAPIEVRGNQAAFTHAPWVRDRRLAARLSGTDVLIGGPPCQGHSNLNNHTRRFDPRNELYLTMPAVAIALDIPIVIIENVREVLADRLGVVGQTIELLRAAGYGVAEGVLSAMKLGIPQTRHRYFLVAVKGAPDGALKDLISPLHRPSRDLRWAIGDLESREDGEIHRPAMLSAENRRRIDYLFDNDLHELPNAERPDCHKNGHTYRSVYGRLRWDQPSGTITTGFLTPGRGRYVHPTQRRALTPHEAARIQGFPDSFRFSYEDGSLPTNKTLTKVIGDAVPPQMGQAAILAAMQMRCAQDEREVEAAA
jgi:DNA (cytosine-5)-methyltransferase 1